MECRRARGKDVLLLLLLGGMGSWSQLEAAHFLSPSDVVRALTTPESRNLGIERARVDPELARLLVIDVGDEWFDLPGSRRLELARAWLELWRHAVPRGVVSVLDRSTGKPALSYGPRDHVNLFQRAPRENGPWS